MAGLRNTSRDSCDFALESERIWRDRELLIGMDGNTGGFGDNTTVHNDGAIIVNNPEALIISPPNAINAAYANIYRFGVRVSAFRHERQNQWN